MALGYPVSVWGLAIAVHALSRRAFAFQLLALAIGVCAVSAAMVQFLRLTTEISVLWPTNGLVLGWCLLQPRSRVPAFIAAAFLGHLAASLFVRSGWEMALGLTAANALEITLAWRLLAPITARYPSLGHPHVFGWFAVYAVGVAPLASGLVAAWVLAAHAATPWAEALRTWWSADALGMALFATTVVALASLARRAAQRARDLRALGVPLVALILVTLAVFTLMKTPMLFLTFPPLLWAVFRGGFLGACLGSLVIVGISFPLTYLGLGPAAFLTGFSLPDRFFLLQMFIATTLLSALPVGMVLDQRKRLMRRLHRRESELLELAAHDPLTGLLNRRGLEGRIAHWSGQARGPLSLAWVAFDLDHFKAINDVFGHDRGDACLVHVGRVLEARAQAIGGVAVRYGGEEFVAVLPGASGTTAASWAEGVRHAVQALGLCPDAEQSTVLTVSAGVASRALVSSAPEELAALARAADAALYAAKAGGRNRVVAAHS